MVEEQDMGASRKRDRAVSADTVAIPSALDALASLCEQAVGPDREIDFAIHAALRMKEKAYHTGGYKARNAKARTATIDAARTLIPAGCWWAVGQDTDFAWATVTPWGSERTYEGLNCRTPELALCAAALRALSAQAIEARQGQDPKGLDRNDESAVLAEDVPKDTQP